MKADVDLNKRAGELTSEELERIVTISTARPPADGAGLSVSARRRANGFAQSLFLWVLRRELGDFVAYGRGGGCGCTTITTHVKNGIAALTHGKGLRWLFSRRRS